MKNQFLLHRQYAECAEITEAERELRSAKAAAKSSKRERDAAEKSLRRELHFVVVVLSNQLGKSDPRWLEFGLKQPRREAPPASAHYGREVSMAAPMVVDFGPESAAPGSDKAAA